MTSTLSRSVTKAAREREQAIARITKRMGKVAQDSGRVSTFESAIGSGCGIWSIVATDGHAALLSRAKASKPPSTQVLAEATTGPVIPIPAAFAPALVRVKTCAPSGKRIPTVAVLVGADRITLKASDNAEACSGTTVSATEWMPADTAGQMGRHFGADARLLLEGLAIAGQDGWLQRVPRALVEPKMTQSIAGERFEGHPVIFISADQLWAYGVMPVRF